MTKTSKKFAWCPTKVTSKQTVWLKYYYEHRCTIDPITGRPPLSSVYFSFTETANEQLLRILRNL